MNKFTRATTCALFGLLAIGATGCSHIRKNTRGVIDIDLWTGFGAAYTTHLSKLIDFEWNNKQLNVEHSSQGGYDNLQKNINATLNTGDYPNMANGYPDHFAGYAKEDALLDLTEMIEEYDQAHINEAGYTKLLDDYYPEYMVENKTLVTDKIMGVPFNKSTELVGYNGVFFDYAKSVDPTITKVPETWAEWAVVGPKLRAVQKTLCGHKLYGKQTEEGTASAFSIDVQAEGTKLLIDFTKVKENECRVLSWDSADNMFITIVRQWGSQYTSYTDEDRQSPLQQGYIEFGSEVNRPKTIAAMTYFNQLYKAEVFGLPADFNAAYSSEAFEANKVMFMVCSTGGLSYNINPGQRFRCAPLPYYKDADATRKYVISQGTNLAIFDAKSNNPDMSYEDCVKKSFETLVDFTTGDLQAQWSIDTGYFPASKSAANSQKYQDFLNDDSYEDPILVAYREGSKVNHDFYMDENPGDGVRWEKFVDPGFDGSSTIRKRVAYIMGNVFAHVGVAGDPTTYDDILNEVYKDLKKFVRN